MQNPFLLVRTVLLALLVYLTFLTFVFAIWNIVAAKALAYAPGAAVFLIFNSCFIFIFTAAGSANFLIPKANISAVRFECIWSLIVSILQLAAAITASATGPALQCQPRSSWSMCSSSVLLAQTAWLSGLMAVTYFLTLLVSALAHQHVYPSIWTTKVSSVPWFSPHEAKVQSNIEAQRTSHAHSHAYAASVALSDRSSLGSLPSNIISEDANRTTPPSMRGGTEPNSSRPRWAMEIHKRPALDEPFPVPRRLVSDPQPVEKRKVTTVPRSLPRDSDVPQDAHYVDLTRDTLLYLDRPDLRLSRVSEWGEEGDVNVPIVIPDSL